LRAKAPRLAVERFILGTEKVAGPDSDDSSDPPATTVEIAKPPSDSLAIIA